MGSRARIIQNTIIGLRPEPRSFLLIRLTIRLVASDKIPFFLISCITKVLIWESITICKHAQYHARRSTKNDYDSRTLSFVLDVWLTESVGYKALSINRWLEAKLITCRILCFATHLQSFEMTPTLLEKFLLFSQLNPHVVDHLLHISSWTQYYAWRLSESPPSQRKLLSSLPLLKLKLSSSSPDWILFHQSL